LLLDTNSSTLNRQATAKTVSHEIAHSWFGNQVSPEWWSYLWLNEGFARFIEHFAVTELFPEWDLWTQFVANVLGTALTLDSLRNSHPVEVEVYNAGEINEIFDSISYAKGGSINRMLANFLTPQILADGLHYYLNKFAYSTATTEDLWDSLGHIAGKDVSAMMNTWVKQTGYPLITVEKTDTGKLRLSQTRYLADGSTDDTKWIVPIRYSTNLVKDKLYVLEGVSGELDIGEGVEWVKLNSESVGFYRVRYPEDMLTQLSKVLHSLSAADRLGIISDQFALAQTGHISMSNFLQLLESFKDETDFYVWSEISSNLGFLSQIFDGTSVFPSFQAFVRRLYANVYQRLGWDNKEGDGPMESSFRAIVINRLLKADDENVVEEARSRFRAHNTTPILPDFRSCVFAAVVAKGDSKEFEIVRKIYRDSESHTEKLRALQALCSTKDEKLIKELIDMTFNEVRLQDVSYPLSSLAHNASARDQVWNHVKSVWDPFIWDRFGKGNFTLSGVAAASISGFSTFAKADDIEHFVQQNKSKISGAERSFQQGVEKIRFRAGIMAKEEERLRIWLEDSI
jgi:puromycin-sensitive aminopeptidase